MYIYKFMPIFDHRDRVDWIKDIIQNKRIYVPSAEKLNDPFELAIQWRSAEFSTSNTASIHKLFLHTNLVQNTGVLSFSNNFNDILMWSHYSDSHKGVCLKFKIIDKKFYLNNFKKVRYCKQIPIHDESDFLWSKSKDWKYEKEVRYLSDINVDCKVSLSELGLELTNVILGPKVSTEDFGKIVKICNGNFKKYLQKAQLHNSQYKIILSEKDPDEIVENYFRRNAMKMLVKNKTNVGN